MEIVKGRTATIEGTIYSKWTGQVATSTPANLTGATINVYFKDRDTDSDAAALFVLSGTVTDALNGGFRVVIPASNTNGLSQSKIFVEPVAKLASGEYIGNGNADTIVLRGNVGKTLF